METTARGDVPKTLQTIAYISIPNSADLEFLLWDLQDAIAAYAQLSGTALPRPVDLKADDAGSVVDGIVFAVEDVLMARRWPSLNGRSNVLKAQEHASMWLFKPTVGVPSRRTRSLAICTKCASVEDCRGVEASSSAPALASQHFAALRVWASCVGHFRKR